jgi:hypothetical protein
MKNMSDGNYFYKFKKLENGSEFTVEKSWVIISTNLSKR